MSLFIKVLWLSQTWNVPWLIHSSRFHLRVHSLVFLLYSLLLTPSFPGCQKEFQIILAISCSNPVFLSYRFQTQLQSHFGKSKPFSNSEEQEGASYMVVVDVNSNHLCLSITHMILCEKKTHCTQYMVYVLLG